MDYSCHFLCTLSSLPRSLLSPRPCSLQAAHVHVNRLRARAARINVRARAKKAAVTSAPFHGTPPLATPSLLFIQVPFQVPVPGPAVPRPLCNRPVSHQITLASGGDSCLQQQERKKGWERGETSRDRESAGSQRSREGKKSPSAWLFFLLITI